MAAGLVTPTEAGMGPSVLGIAASIGAKIRDAAQDAKEQREKAAEKGETPKKGSLFKSSLANQFNPIKSKKAKSNWAKQFDWNKKSDSDQQVKPPTGGGGDGAGKLKEFIAGGFTAILKDTGMMVSKLDGVKMMTGESLAEVTRSSSTLTVIKDSIDTQTELRRKALEEAKFARAEKKLEKTSDVAGLSDIKKSEDKGDGEGGGGDGGGPFDWILNLLGLGDLASNIPGKWLQKLNPFKKSPVTQGAGGKPPGPRMPGTSPRVTTTGGAAAPKMPGGFKMPGMPKGAGGVLGKLAAPLMVLDLYNTTKEVLNPDDNILTSLGDLGSSIFNVFQSDPNKKNLYDVRGEGPQADRARMFNQRILGEREKYNSNSEGGIVPLSRGGIAPGLYDNPTQGMLSPGQSVIPLNRSEGKEMFGKSAATSPGETAMDTVGAMILGVSAGMLGKTDTGTVGDQVKQKIRKASKEFGISNLTFTSSIGKAQFKKVDPNKTAKDFMMSLFDGLQIAGGKGKKSGGGGGGGNPPGGTPESLKADLEADIGKSGAQMKDEIMQSGATGIIDPTQGPWCAAYVNAQLKRNGIQGSGSPAANSYENWGAPVDKNNIKYGDVLVGDYGAGSKSHVMFAAGSPKDGAVEIIGGNQSGVVSRGSIALDKIDYARRAGAQPPALPTQRNNGQATPPPTAPSPQPAPNPNNKPAEANLPTGTVSPIFDWNKKTEAEDGGAWWNPFSWGKIADKERNTNKGLGYNARYSHVTDPEMRRMMGLPPMESRAKGGTTNQAKMRQKMRASEKSKRATNQRLNLGLVKGGNNSGYAVAKTGMRPGESPDQWAQRQSDAIKLADKLNKEQGLGKYAKPQAPKPKPAPARAPSQAGGTRPAPSSGGQSQSAAVVMPPASSMKAPTAQATGSFGSAVPGGKTSAMVFADFLYPDLV
jgi:hypothetical protein